MSRSLRSSISRVRVPVRPVADRLLAVGLLALALAGCAKDGGDGKTAAAREVPTYGQKQEEVERVLARFGGESGRVELDADGGRYARRVGRRI